MLKRWRPESTDRSVQTCSSDGDQNQQLCDEYSQKHAQRVDRSVVDGRIVGSVGALREGEDGGVGHASGDQAADLVEVQLADVPGDQSDRKHRDKRNERSVQDPPVASAHDGSDEVLAGPQPDGRHEEGESDLPDHQVGALGGVRGDLPPRSEVAEQDGDDEGASPQARA